MRLSGRILDDRSFRRVLHRATLALCVALGMPTLTLLALVLILLQAASMVDHTDRIIHQTNQLQRSLHSLQTNFRGHRLSNSPEHLERFQREREKLSDHQSELREMVADRKSQGARTDRVAERIAAWLSLLDEQLKQEQTRPEARQDASYLRWSIPLFDLAVSELDHLASEERRRLAARTRNLDRGVTVLLAALTLGALGGIPLLAVWLQRLLREVNASFLDSVRRAERRTMELAITLRSIGDAVIVTDLVARVDFLNPVAEELTGWSNKEANGRELTDVFPIFDSTTGERLPDPLAGTLEEGSPADPSRSAVLRTRNGREIKIEKSSAPILADEGEMRGSILVFRDVTEMWISAAKLRESEQRLRFLNELSESTRTLSDPPAIMKVTTRMLGRHLGVSRCAYAAVDPDGNGFTILEDYTDGCASSAGTYDLSRFGPRAAALMHEGHTLRVDDMDVEVAPDEGGKMFEAIAVKAIICHPLVKDGRLRAMMAVHQTRPRSWTRSEVALVEEVVERCWSTIERARAEQESRERTRLSLLRAEIADQLGLSEPLDRILQGCCDLLVRHLDAECATIWICDEPRNTLQRRAHTGPLVAERAWPGTIEPGEGVIGRVAETHMSYFSTENGNTVHPLLVEDSLIGVVGISAEEEFSKATLGDLAPLVAAMAQQIQRKKAEAALEAATARAESAALAVVEAAERFRLLSEVVALQVWTAGPDGRLDFANAEVGVYFGVAVGPEILGDGWARFVHPEDLPGVAELWREALETGQPYETEFRLRRADGEYRWFLTRAEAMRNASGEVETWFGINTDIHELKLAQAEADRASRAKDDFLAVLSHELRTPLTPVLMAAAALGEDERLPADVRSQLGMMERNIGLEARLIDDLLDITRIAKGKLPLRQQWCDVHSLIGLAIEIVRDDAQSKSVALEQDFHARFSGLMTDPSRFQQVIWNLLRNAVKFTPPQGSITIRTRDLIDGEGARRLSVEVQDTGIGIEPAAIERIFHPFEQAGLTGDHRFGGIGLGLAIARAIVDLHGGTIRAESRGSNQGSAFIVEFPGARQPPSGMGDSGSSPSPSPPEGAEEGKSGALRLLLVEDHKPTLQVLERLLTRAGHRVISANSVAAALAAAKDQQFDGVISDLGLPDGTGNELMEQLRDRHRLQGIALTGYGMEDDLERSREAGFVMHLIKPIDFDQLRRALAVFRPD